MVAAFGSARRPGLGSPSRAAGAPQRAAAPAPSASRRDDRPKSQWTTTTTLYDAWHSAMEPQVVAEFYRTGLCIKLAPVFAERRGPEDGGTGKKYNYDEALMAVFGLEEAIVFRAQLDAFINGQLTEVIIPRGETKRVILTPATTYYQPTDAEYAQHANGLALSIEQDATDRSDAATVVFVSRQQAIKLADEGEPLAFFPELQALLAIVDSYINACARVDFASVRLLEGRGQAEERPAGPSAPMPMRRGGVSAPGNAAPSAAGGAAAPAASATASVTQTAAVSDADIDAALGGSTEALDAVLADAPRF